MMSPFTRRISGRLPDRPTPLLMVILLVIAVGIGMLLSAAVSFMIARALGLANGRTSTKGDAG